MVRGRKPSGNTSALATRSLVAISLEIERNRALVAIECGMECRKLPRGVPDALPFDNNDVGSEIGHEKGLVGSRTAAPRR